MLPSVDITLSGAQSPGGAGHDAQPLDAVTLRRGVQVDDVGGVAQPRLDIAVDSTVDIFVDISISRCSLRTLLRDLVRTW